MALVSGSMVRVARHISSLPLLVSSLPRHLSSLPPSLPLVLHQPSLRQFTLQVEGHEAAVLRYTCSPPTSSPTSPPTLTMYSTVVPPTLAGRGVAKVLADAAFEHAVEQGGGLRLTCWYLAGYLARHPRREVEELIVQ